ncbi:MAG: AAA family ATPase [Alphaproteobacteria bacterium]|nr:AAA family ATPase [Alphaproteobacteria bacterium]
MDMPQNEDMPEGDAPVAAAVPDPIADILEWSAGRPTWQQDALRRLAVAGFLTEADKAELTAFVRKEGGLPVEGEPPEMVPLGAENLGSGGSSSGVTTRVLGIHDIRHVGRMAGDAHLTFSRDGLTAVLGDNGAGKSGYTRILRRVGSGRGDDPKKKILPDVFADAPAADATAIIDIEINGAKEAFTWSAATLGQRIPGLTVFDADATQAYVDFGNAIELLPFNIDIIQGLIEFCDEVREILSGQVKALSTKLEQTSPKIAEGTKAAAFVAGLSGKTTAQEIADKLTLSADQKARLKDLRQSVLAPQEKLRTKTVLAPLLDAAGLAVESAEDLLGDAELEVTRTARFEAKRKAETARDLNAHLFEGCSLPVSSPLWKEMWEAARVYAQTDSHPDHAFPQVEDGALCPLCQQVLQPEAQKRFRNLEDYVSTQIQQDAEEAAELFGQRIEDLDAALKEVEGTLAKLDLSQEDPVLAADLAAWRQAAQLRRASIDTWLDGQSALAPVPTAVAARLVIASENTRQDIERLTAGAGSPEAQAQAAELRELEAWEVLEAGKVGLEQRVRDLATQEALQACVDSANPQQITKFFNALKDRYLTESLRDAYAREIAALKLERLKVTVTPKKNRDAAKFIIDLDGRKITDCKLSEILSEGERRALSLAAFLAEQSIGGGCGCLVFDDPVSSLDHSWAQVIAGRLADEATRRQVVVFTHDLVFYDKLCTAVEGTGGPLDFQQLFHVRSAGTAGHVDPIRGKWNSQKVKNRIHELKTMVAKAAKTADESAGQYERDAKQIYGRMRDAWERLVEELLLYGMVQRFQKDIQTKKLRYLTADPVILSRIESGMTRCSTYSHDNPGANTDPIPEPKELAEDLAELEAVAEWLKKHHDTVK